MVQFALKTHIVISITKDNILNLMHALIPEMLKNIL